jgi:hypothetical protein
MMMVPSHTYQEGAGGSEMAATTTIGFFEEYRVHFDACTRCQDHLEYDTARPKQASCRAAWAAWEAKAGIKVRWEAMEGAKSLPQPAKGKKYGKDWNDPHQYETSGTYLLVSEKCHCGHPFHDGEEVVQVADTTFRHPSCVKIGEALWLQPLDTELVPL